MSARLRGVHVQPLGDLEMTGPLSIGRTDLKREDALCIRCTRVGVRRALAALAALALTPRPAAAAPEVSPDPWPSLSLDVGIFSALPAALDIGQSLGFETTIGSAWGSLLYGASASLSQAAEDTASWRVTHTEVRVRGLVGLRTCTGLGAFAIRLAAGVSLVHETRERHQAGRLGAVGTALSSDAWVVLPALDLQGGIDLRVIDEWGIALFLGPSLHFGGDVGGAHLGWAGSVGITWSP